MVHEFDFMEKIVIFLEVEILIEGLLENGMILSHYV